MTTPEVGYMEHAVGILKDLIYEIFMKTSLPTIIFQFSDCWFTHP